MHVAVTGATGFLGVAVTAELLRRGVTVTALVRTPGRLPRGVERVHGDVSDARSLTALVDGASAVVHAAALVRSNDGGALRTVNIEGTRNVVLAAADVPRFVHLSTAGVHGRPSRAVDETAPMRPLNAYESSKVEAEGVVRAARHAETVIVRPTDVIGIGHPLDPLVRFFRAVQRGTVWVSPRAWRNYVAVDDVAMAVAAAALGPQPPATVIVNAPMLVGDLVTRAATILGVEPRVGRIPAAVARLAEPLLVAVAGRVTGAGRVAALVDTTRFDTMHTDWFAHIGLHPNLDNALREMVAGYRDRGLL